MRPGFTGRKCQGVLEAHQNGLRFTSTKAETVDIMYQNVKHAIYQPCEKTTLVLVHFHLKVREAPSCQPVLVRHLFTHSSIYPFIYLHPD